jgi:hypothetical protein
MFSYFLTKIQLYYVFWSKFNSLSFFCQYLRFSHFFGQKFTFLEFFKSNSSLFFGQKSNFIILCGQKFRFSQCSAQNPIFLRFFPKIQFPLKNPIFFHFLSKNLIYYTFWSKCNFSPFFLFLTKNPIFPSLPKNFTFQFLASQTPPKWTLINWEKTKKYSSWTTASKLLKLKQKGKPCFIAFRIRECPLFSSNFKFSSFFR